MIAKEQILQALSEIIDPDFNADIVSLGFIKNLKVDGSKVSFDIQLTTPACPIKSQFQKKAEELVQGIDGVEAVSVNMTSLPRKTANTPQNIPSTLNKVKSIIAVSSCKGGVGKSTIAAHLSLELAQRGFKVGLVDSDIHGPSIPTLFNLQNTPVYVNEEEMLIPIEKHHLKIMSFGFLLGEGPAVMRGPMVAQYLQQILHTTDWGDLDYLFVDMPPGTGDVQLTITQTVNLSGAVIVTTPQTLSLVDVARGILMFEKVNVPILGIIENMSYFICDQCDKKHYIFGGDTSGALTDRFGLETMAEIPLLPEWAAKIDHPIKNEYLTQAVDHVIMALGKSMIQQKLIPEVHFDEKNISLKWPDGEKASVSNRDMRLSCRCALCINELTGEQILRSESIKPDIAPKKITPLGNYAIGIEWNDGHSSGIYPYRNIRKLAGVAI